MLAIENHPRENVTKRNVDWDMEMCQRNCKIQGNGADQNKDPTTTTDKHKLTNFTQKLNTHENANNVRMSTEILNFQKFRRQLFRTKKLIFYKVTPQALLAEDRCFRGGPHPSNLGTFSQMSVFIRLHHAHVFQ